MSEKVLLAKKISKILGLAFLVLTIIFFAKSYIDGHFHSLDSFKNYINSFGLFAPIMLFFIQFFQVIIPFLPGLFGCIAGSLLFGAVNGFWINYLAISIGSITAFFIAKKYGSPVVKGLIGEKFYDKYLGWTMKDSFLWIFALAIFLPLTPDDELCLLAGLTPISKKKFILIIVTMKPWCILFYSIFAAHLASLVG